VQVANRHAQAWALSGAVHASSDAALAQVTIQEFFC
jgi:hypothetical protein